MPLPLTDPDTLFEELLQDLPAETVPMARSSRRSPARKNSYPAQRYDRGRQRRGYCGVGPGSPVHDQRGNPLYARGLQSVRRDDD